MRHIGPNALPWWLFHATLIVYDETECMSDKQEEVTISKEEYERLRALEEDLGRFVKYMRYVESIEEAREDVRRGNTTPLDTIMKEYSVDED